MFFNTYPYTDGHELNLDWILAKIMELHRDFDEFQAINSITFDGAWNIAKQYKPWTIVNHNGAGYISIVPVPAGIQITDTDYWRGVIDYTATIADLQNRVIVLEGKVSALESETELLTKRRFIFVGDSYGAGSGTYVDRLMTRMGISSGDYYNACVSGTGFSTTPNFVDNIQAIENSVVNPDTITDIVILGGINDAISPINGVAVVNNISAMNTYIRATYKNARVWVGFLGNVKYDTTSPDTRTQADIRLIIQYYIGAGNNEGWRYISNCENIMRIRGLFGADGLHPDTNGQEYISKCLYNGLTTGHIEITETITASSITPATGVTTNVTVEPLVVNNNVSSFAWNAGDVLGSFYTSDLNTQIDIGTFDDCQFVSNNEPLRISANTRVGLTIDIGGGNIRFITTNVILDFCNGHIYIRNCGDFSIDGTAFLSGTITGIAIPYGAITIPTLFI